MGNRPNLDTFAIREQRIPFLIKPQDIFVALRLVLKRAPGTYANLGAELGMSASEVHGAVRRLQEARLVNPNSQSVRREELLRFLVNGVPYVFPAQAKEVTRGLPTAWGHPVLASRFADSTEPPPVWPSAEGNVRGVAVKPLYPSVPQAVASDPELYTLLALVDALRVGRARERNLAQAELTKRIEADEQ